MKKSLSKQVLQNIRREIMFNEYVISRPFKRSRTNYHQQIIYLEVFRKLSKAMVNFVSRGDLSGTHKKEIEIWKKINFQS